MKNKLMKSLVAAGAVAMICACGDDSNTSNAQDNPCEKVAVTSLAWIWDSGLGYWVIYPDGNVTDAAGNTVAAFDGTNVVMTDGTLLAQVNTAELSTCEANATIDPTTGNVVINSSASTDTGDPQDPTSSTTNPTSNAATDPNSSADANPTSSAGTSTDPTSSAGSATESSSSEAFVNTSPLSKMSLEGYPVASYKDISGNGTYGWNTRYWDACKPHCSWISNGQEGKTDTTTQASYEAGMTTARNCNIHDIEVPTFTLGHAVQKYWMGYEGTTSACEVGAAGVFTCTDMAPIAVNDTLSYAYVAGPGSSTTCGKCFHLQYDGSFKDVSSTNAPKETHKALKGKHIIVMTSNIGHDVANGQFDLMVPGGGPGIFNALNIQVNGQDIEWGAQYGGFLTYCQGKLGYDKGLTDYQNCIHEMCDAAFKDSGFDNLYRGCTWFADWYMAADNPTYQWEEVECPQYLLDHYLTTINTSIETKILYQSDWSTYKGGDFITTEACGKTPNAQGEYCDPEQLAIDKAKTY